MISLLIGLLLLLQPERIYSGTLAYSSQVEQVVINRQWDNTEYFDVLLAVPDCGYLSYWAWVITEDGDILEGVIVDCSRPEHRQQMISRGLVADVNLERLNSKRAWVVVR